MKVYLASAYGRKEEMREYARQLTEMGIGVTSTWINEPHAPNAKMSQADASDLQLYAVTDLLDIDDADSFAFFSEDPETSAPRGGRHVEFGYALANNKRVFVVGPKENIFHYLPEVEHFSSWAALLVYLAFAKKYN